MSPQSTASTSAQPYATTPASYHPNPRPKAAAAFQRIDTNEIKQQLHDALGADGLPYWKAMNGYLLGQVGREELENLVKGWLKGKNLQLHNKLLVSLLHNASAPPLNHLPPSPALQKRKKPDSEAVDDDDTVIEPKARVHQWVMGIGGRERNRVRRAVMGADEEDGEGEDEEEVADDGRRWNGLNRSQAQPPLALPTRLLPSSHQLSHRLSSLAKSFDLNVAPETGEFMGVGLDSHLSDILHSYVHLTGSERPGGDTIRVPTGAKHDVGMENGNGNEESGSPGKLPPPTLDSFSSLLQLKPFLNPHSSATLYKLATGLTRAEKDAARPIKVEKREPTEKTEKLVELGVLKWDKAGRQSEGGDEVKKGKHNLHWKYEDPALIFKDVLG
ncbi:transcriptional coactivator HFI1/ADA1, partial [Tremellales sp. Uapishka_1]